MLELKKTNHSYYCSESNYYVDGNSNFGCNEYDTWEDFREAWLGMGEDGLGIDMDYNLCFRFDIRQKRDVNDELINNRFELWLFFMLQRRGIYRPVFVKNINYKDMHEISIFLERQWEYISRQWAEFSQ